MNKRFLELITEITVWSGTSQTDLVKRLNRHVKFKRAIHAVTSENTSSMLMLATIMLDTTLKPDGRLLLPELFQCRVSKGTAISDLHQAQNSVLFELVLV